MKNQKVTELEILTRVKKQFEAALRENTEELQEVGKKISKTNHDKLVSIKDGLKDFSYHPAIVSQMEVLDGLIAREVVEDNTDDTDVQEAVSRIDQISQISSAFRTWAYSKRDNKEDAWPFTRYYLYDVQIYDDFIIAKDEQTGFYYKITFSRSGSDFTFATPVKVEFDFKVVEQVQEEDFEGKTDGTILQEVKGTKGREWDVILIESGMSLNGRYYPADVLKKSVALFEGVPAYADHTNAQTLQSGRSVQNKIGKYSNVTFQEWTDKGGKATSGLKARLKLIAPWAQQLLVESFDSDEPDFVGLSIEASGKLTYKDVDKRRVGWVESITKVSSVDLVTDPAAGGRIERLVASMHINEEKKVMDLEQLLEMLKTNPEQAKLFAAALGIKLDAEDKTLPILEQVKTLTEQIAAIDAEKKVLQTKERVSTILGEYKTVPEPFKVQLRERFVELGSRRDWEDAELKAEADVIVETLAKMTPVAPSGSSFKENFRVGDAEVDKFDKAIQGMFDKEDIDGVPRFRGLVEAFCRMTGADSFDVNSFELFDALAVKYDSQRDHKKLRESITTATFGQIYADNMYLKMLRTFRGSDLRNIWTKFVSDFDDFNDFRTHHFARMGGYGDLPAVGEGATYQPLTTPGDEEVSFTITKHGGLESLTMEAILNNRANALANIPIKMGRAADRTLFKFIMALITTTNPTMGYDSTALYHADHGNLDAANAGLSLAALNNIATIMRGQQPYDDTNEYLGEDNYPRFLIVPPELEALAKRITNPSEAFLYALNQQAGAAATGAATTPDLATLLDPHMFKDRGIETVVYDYLTDATDYYVMADPKKVNTVIVGFLNGRREPELFIQDNPTVGSAFTADKITYKIRHIYGAGIADHRGFYKAVVSG